MLVDNGFVLTESVAINSYMASEHAPSSGLLPIDPRERALHDGWLHTINCELDAQGLYVERKHHHLAHVYGAAPTAVQAAQEYFALQLRSATAVLATQPYPLSHVTAADLLPSFVLLWARNEGWLPEGGVVLIGYLERNAARPACVATQHMGVHLPHGTTPLHVSADLTY